MDWLDTLTGDTRGRLLRLVRGGPRSISELAAALGISENAVRGHVAAAERDGLVRQAGVQRSTGGKPARLYELAPGAEELFPKAYALVLTELVRTLRQEESEEAALELLRRVGRRLGARAASADGDGSPGEGADSDDSGHSGSAGAVAAARVLESLGGAVDVTQEAHGWTVRSAGCPLSRVVAADPAVCALAEALVAEVSGRPVRERCDRSRRPRCAFDVLERPPQ